MRIKLDINKSCVSQESLFLCYPLILSLFSNLSSTTLTTPIPSTYSPIRLACKQRYVLIYLFFFLLNNFLKRPRNGVNFFFLFISDNKLLKIALNKTKQNKNILENYFCFNFEKKIS